MTQNYYSRRPARGVNGMGVASLFIGLTAAVGFWAPVFGAATIPLAVIGLILGFVGIIVAAVGGRSRAGIPIVATLVCIGVIAVNMLMKSGFMGGMGLPTNNIAQPQPAAPAAGQPAMPMTQVPAGGISVPAAGAGPVAPPDDSIFSPGYSTNRPTATPVAPVVHVDSAKVQECRTAVANASRELDNRKLEQTQAVNAAVAARHLQPDYVALAKTASDLRAKIDDMRERRADPDEIEPVSKQWLADKETLTQMDSEPMKSPAVLDAIANVKTAGDALTKANAALVQAGGGQ